MMKLRFITVLLLVLIPCSPALWAQEAPGNLLEVYKSAICPRIVDRQPVDQSVKYPADVGKVYCFSHISNIESPTQIKHVWIYDNIERARVALEVQPPSWRTYSSKRILPSDTGRWRVDILDQDGNVLKTLGFDIAP